MRLSRAKWLVCIVGATASSLLGACGAFSGVGELGVDSTDAGPKTDATIVLEATVIPVPDDDAGGSQLDATLDAVSDATTIPAGFPSHVQIPTSLTMQSTAGLCEIDTSAPSYSICGSSKTSMNAPSNMIVQGNNVVLFTSALDITAQIVVTGTRGLIIVSTGDFTLETSASIDVSAAGTNGGPGASTSGKGVTSTDKEGPGGGGYGTSGAKGGMSTENSTDGESGGTAYGTDASTLVGGSPGGAGSATSVGCGAAGAGGGVIQISASGAITIMGTIRAAGGGGQGGCSQDQGPGSGGGGGSGGEIFLEALTSVTVGGFGALAANGGGGAGGGSGSDDTNGQSGRDGTTTMNAADGGPAANGNEGSGGNGGVGVTAPTPGQDGNQAGAGGGAVGRVWIRRWNASIVLSGIVTPGEVMF